MNRRVALAVLLLACGDAEHAHESEPVPPHADDGVVRIAPEALETAQIELGRAERRALSGGASVPGELRFDPLSTAHVASLVAGRFEAVEVELGERVRRGQVLATMASADASGARAGLARAQARLRAAESALSRQRQLVEEGIGARRGFIEAEAEVRALQAEVEGIRTQLGVLGSGTGAGVRLVAPIDGVVVHIHATPGETATPDQEAFTIADPSAISVYGEVPELAIASVSVGLAVLFRPHAFPELALPGVIRYVAPAIEPSTRSLPIRVVLETIDPRLVSGMYGAIELSGDDARPVTVPVDAVATVEGRTVVFTPEDTPGTFVAVPVELGRRAGGHYEVRRGLEEGARLVVAGAFTLKSVMQRSELSEGHHH